jgi:hypothetical protein
MSWEMKFYKTANENATVKMIKKGNGSPRRKRLPSRAMREDLLGWEM